MKSDLFRSERRKSDKETVCGGGGGEDGFVRADAKVKAMVVGVKSVIDLLVSTEEAFALFGRGIRMVEARLGVLFGGEGKIEKVEDRRDVELGNRIRRLLGNGVGEVAMEIEFLELFDDFHLAAAELMKRVAFGREEQKTELFAREIGDVGVEISGIVKVGQAERRPGL